MTSVHLLSWTPFPTRKAPLAFSAWLYCGTTSRALRDLRVHPELLVPIPTQGYGKQRHCKPSVKGSIEVMTEIGKY